MTRRATFFRVCVLCLSFGTITAPASAELAVVSASRQAGQDYRKAARNRYENLELLASRGTAWEQAGPLENAGIERAPRWPSMSFLKAVFRKWRDQRFLQWEVQPDFPRRPSWLYPQDGCFARAAVFKERIAREGPRPAKIFAFGNLSMQTRYSSSGQVDWWYHVAPVVRVGDTAYVLDPSVEPERPLTMSEWIERFAEHDDSVKVAICEPYTYEPHFSCLDSTEEDEAWAELHQETYLTAEWEELRHLGYDPEKILGDRPPWDEAIYSKLLFTPARERTTP